MCGLTSALVKAFQKKCFLSNCLGYFFCSNCVYSFSFIIWTFCLACMFITCVPGPCGVQKRVSNAQNRNYRRLWATMEVLGIQARFSARAASVFNLWAISPASQSPLYANFSHSLMQICMTTSRHWRNHVLSHVCRGFLSLWGYKVFPVLFCFALFFWSDKYSPCIFSSLLHHIRLGQAFLSLFFISVSSILGLELEYRRLIMVHFLCKSLVFPSCAICTHLLRSQDHGLLHIIWPSSKGIPPPRASVTCAALYCPFPHKLLKLQFPVDRTGTTIGFTLRLQGASDSKWKLQSWFPVQSRLIAEACSGSRSVRHEQLAPLEGWGGIRGKRKGNKWPGRLGWGVGGFKRPVPSLSSWGGGGCSSSGTFKTGSHLVVQNVLELSV